MESKEKPPLEEVESEEVGSKFGEELGISQAEEGDHEEVNVATWAGEDTLSGGVVGIAEGEEGGVA
jgi:hypothetical protein